MLRIQIKKRIHASDPGTVEGNPVFIYHDAFNLDIEMVNDLKYLYRKGKVGDIEVKEKLFDALNNFLIPIREKRLAADKEPIRQYLENGTSRAREIAGTTLQAVRSAMHLQYPSLK